MLDGGYSHDVMLAASDTLARLQRALGAALMHGDYGPHNLLLDSNACEVVLVADWEFAELLGRPIPDLAWAEWVVRMHHPEQVQSIEALFAGYGHRPPSQELLAAMVERCSAFAARAQLRGDPSARRLWEQRRAICVSMGRGRGLNAG